MVVFLLRIGVRLWNLTTARPFCSKGMTTALDRHRRNRLQLYLYPAGLQHCYLCRAGQSAAARYRILFQGRDGLLAGVINGQQHAAAKPNFEFGRLGYQHESHHQPQRNQPRHHYVTNGKPVLPAEYPIVLVKFP